MTSIKRKIKLLIAEDSIVQKELLSYIFDSDPEIKIVGFVHNGIDSIKALKYLMPDIILMDLHMPDMNGIEAIRQIMTENPLPIVAMSASNSADEMVNSIHALEAGALAFVEKPKSIQDPQFECMCDYLVSTVKLMSEVKVVRRYSNIDKLTRPADSLLNKNSKLISKQINLIAIGVSTGGPLVLKKILKNISSDFPPILIVQHIVPGFIQGVADWLTLETKHHVEIATNHQLIQRNHIYFAPDFFNMSILKSQQICLTPKDIKYNFCPSVNFLFNSVYTNIKDRAMGILLTGMGGDGADQLKKMKEAGAITIAQDKESSMIYGMPERAAALGAATFILTPDEISDIINSLSRDEK